MELKRAKEVIIRMGLIEELNITSIKSDSFQCLRMLDPDMSYVVGHLSTDQLEAIATWMRDPEGVVKA